MGRRSRTHKENARKERKRVKALVESAFNHFGKDELYEEQFIKYFRDQGMSKEDADKLWINAHSMNIIRIGIRPIFREGDPLNILGHVTVFTLRSKEYA